MLYGSLNPLMLLLLLPYTLRCFEVVPRPQFGAEVLGVNMNTVTKETILQLEKAVIEHRWLLFRGQNVSRERQVEITTWLGPWDETAKETNDHFYGGRRELENENIVTLSNDPDEGLVRLGVQSMHSDSIYRPLPIHYCLWHMEHASRGGITLFVDLVRTLNEAPAAMRERWEQMSFTLNNPRVTHPLVFTHPRTGNKSIIFNLAYIKKVIFNNNTDDEYQATDIEKKRILCEIMDQLKSNNKLYEHVWQDGDFVLSDNLAVAHRATASTQLPRSEVGLRRLHRSSTGAEYPPTKNYTVACNGRSLHEYYQDPNLPSDSVTDDPHDYSLRGTVPGKESVPDVQKDDVSGKGGVPGEESVPGNGGAAEQNTIEACVEAECDKLPTKNNDEL